jgi:hypothetical protein
VQAEVYGGHADVAAGGVHDAVVVGEGEGAGAALGGWDVSIQGVWFGLRGGGREGEVWAW